MGIILSIAPIGGTIPSTSSVLLSGENDGFAWDFQAATPNGYVRDTETPANTGEFSPDDWWSNSSTTPKLVLNEQDLLAWSPHNLFINSETPGNRTVTVINGETYTVKVMGSGSMALSDGGSGTVTEAAPLTFTASSTSVTFTQSGSLTRIQLNRGTVSTAYLATGGTARIGLAIEYGVGVLSETAVTNLALWSNDFTNATWIKTNLTAAKTATGPDGVANSASTLTATAANATALQSITHASAARITHCWIRRRMGAGNIDLTQDNGTTWTTVSVTTLWQRLKIATQTLSNPTVGIRIVTSGDEVDVAFFQHEQSSTAQPTSPIPTFGATQTRATDGYDVALTPFPFSATEGTIYIDSVAPGDAATSKFALQFDDGTANELIRLYRLTTRDAVSDVLDGGVSQFGTGVALPTWNDNTRGQFTVAWKANDFGASFDGSGVVSDTSGTLPTLTTLRLGRENAGSTWMAYIKRVVYVPRRVPNADLPTWRFIDPQGIDPQNLQLSDFGLSATQSTGSISEGSNELTLVSATGFSVGDTVIIAVGGESGGGNRGTEGVGGTWPALSYANVAAMNADTSQTVNRLAWTKDDGFNYQWNGSEWRKLETVYGLHSYYVSKATPKSLVATITAKAGNVLTLNKTASVAATNATVYRDNLPAFNAARDYTAATHLNNVKMNFPTGSFAFSAPPTLFGKNGWQIIGAGKTLTTLLIPPGTPHTDNILINTGSNITIRDLEVKGNARANGFALNVTEFSIPQGSAFPYGITFTTGVTGGEIRNVKSTDAFQRGIGATACTDIWAYDCECVLTEPLRQYVQWHFMWSDCVGGGAIDCTASGPKLFAGFAMAKSTGVSFIRCTGINAVMEANTCNNFLFEDVNITAEENSQFDATFSIFGWFLNINTNLGAHAVDLGGVIRNATMTEVGYINATNDILRGIAVNANNPNVTIDGGIYTAPDYAAPATSFGPQGLLSTGQGMVATGFTVVGAPRPGPNIYANIFVSNGGQAINCTADLIVVN